MGHLRFRLFPGYPILSVLPTQDTYIPVDGRIEAVGWSVDEKGVDRYTVCIEILSVSSNSVIVGKTAYAKGSSSRLPG